MGPEPSDSQHLSTRQANVPGTLTIAGHIFSLTQEGVCSFTVTPTSQNAPQAAGSHTATVATASACGWTAVSNNTSWLSITSGASRTGSGIVMYSWTQNTSQSSRTGSLRVAGQTLTVIQSGTQSGGCSFTVSPTSQNVVAAGGSQSASLTTTSGCTWSAVSHANWLTVTSAGSSAGSGTVSYTVAANTSASSRTGTLTIGNQTLTITQSAAVPPPAAPRNLRFTS